MRRILQLFCLHWRHIDDILMIAFIIFVSNIGFNIRKIINYEIRKSASIDYPGREFQKTFNERGSFCI